MILAFLMRIIQMNAGKTIYIKINNRVYLYNCNKKIKNKIYNDLTMKNPKYESAMKYGRFIGTNIPSHLHFFTMSVDKKVICVPRGYLQRIISFLKKNKFKIKIKNETIKKSKIKIKFKGKLRVYQEIAVNRMMSYPQGVLEAATGAGKTVMGCALISKRKQSTLIVVHSKELLYQWQSAIKQFLDYDCGLIGDGKFTVKDISVGIINSVKNKTEQLTKKFGYIIVDECHRTPSTTFTETIPHFSAKYILGLSATPYRNDGLGKVINIYLGEKLHTVNKEELEKRGNVLVPKIFRINTDFRTRLNDSYSKIISSLCSNNKRNELIISTICKDLQEYNQNVLVVSDSVKHCKKLQYMLEKRSIKSEVLVGQITKTKREIIVKKVKEGKVKVLIATVSLIGEGFDAPNLTSLFLTTPIKYKGRLLQVIGRILRPEKNKIPRVYDFRDINITALRYQGYHREKIYREQWNYK
jgi:superfamily II DNA or RNA helicase